MYTINIRFGKINITESLIFFILFLGGFILPFFDNFKIHSFADEFYQIMCCQTYYEQPIALLSFGLAHIITYLFGESLLTYKIYTFICYSITNLISCYYFYHITKSRIDSFLIFLILQLCTSYFIHPTFGWDVLSYLTLTICTIILISYLSNPSLFKIILCSIFCTFAIQSRLPNLFILFIGIFIIYYKSKTIKAKIFNVGIFLICSFLLNLSVILIFCESLPDFITLLTSKSFVSKHDNPLLLIGWINGAPQRETPMLFLSFSLFSSVYLGLKIWKDKLSKRIFIFLVTLFFTSYFYILIFTLKDFELKCNYVVGTFYILLFFPFIYSYKNHLPWKHKFIFCLTVFICGFCQCIGSDNGIFKMLRIPLFPLLFTLLYNQQFHKIEPYYIRKALLILSIISVLLYPGMFLRSYKLNETRTCDFHERLNGVKFKTTDYIITKEITDFIKDKSHLKKILFLGENRYLYDYISYQPDYSLHNFHENIDKDFCLTLSNIINEYDFVILKKNISKDKFDILNDYLTNNNYIFEDLDLYPNHYIWTKITK